MEGVMIRLTDPEIELKEFPNCSHAVSEPLVLTVLGKEVKLAKSRACKECLEPYLNKFSLLCIACQDPILPLNQVTANLTYDSDNNKREGRAHAGCAPVGFLDGVWSEGYMVRLQVVPD